VPLFHLTMPSNLMTFLSAICDSLNFNLFDPDKTHQNIYHLESNSSYPAYNSQYDILGYKSSNIIYNLNSSFVMMELYILIIPAIFILKLI
jgi:hypothetical protein